ncbi:hypothetical protein [Marmoricola sp. OAE513]|uniref:hypothetical protein n=1 Tax=Marmoricola sp. OAE513 TaxID=2817894 RepID=UPI001AE334EA
MTPRVVEVAPVSRESIFADVPPLVPEPAEEPEPESEPEPSPEPEPYPEPEPESEREPEPEAEPAPNPEPELPVYDAWPPVADAEPVAAYDAPPAPDEPAEEETFPADDATWVGALPYEPPNPVWTEPPPPGPEDLFEGDGSEEDRRPPFGAFDIVLTLLGGAVAFALAYLVHADIDRIQTWLNGGTCCEYTLRNLAAVLAYAAPLAVAALAAAWSRIPATGFFVALLAELPYVLFGNFDTELNWTIVFTLGGFVLADLILLRARRSVGIGLLVGLVAGAGRAAEAAVDANRQDLWTLLGNNTWLSAKQLVIPAVVILVAGIAGGVAAALRRR